MDLAEFQQQQRFHIRQKERLTRLAYRVHADDDGRPGALVGFVEDRKQAFKQRVTFYTAEDGAQELARLEARKLPGASIGRAVTTADGGQIGVLGRQLAKSAAKTVWVVEQEGLPRITVRERDAGSATVRRLWKVLRPDWLEIPYLLKYHFDLLLDDVVVGAVERQANFEDHYLLRLDDDRLDRRLLLGLAVTLVVEQYRVA